MDTNCALSPFPPRDHPHKNDLVNNFYLTIRMNNGFELLMGAMSVRSSIIRLRSESPTDFRFDCVV